MAECLAMPAEHSSDETLSAEIFHIARLRAVARLPQSQENSVLGADIKLASGKVWLWRSIYNRHFSLFFKHFHFSIGMKRQLVLTEAGKKLRFRKLIQKNKEEQRNYYLANPHILQAMPPLERINPVEHFPPKSAAYPIITVEPVLQNHQQTQCHPQNEKEVRQERRKPNETIVIHFRRANDLNDSVEFYKNPIVHPRETSNKDEEGGHRIRYGADPTIPELNNTIKNFQAGTYTGIDTIEKDGDTRKDTPENENNYKCYVHKKFRTIAEYLYSDQQIKENRYVGTLVVELFGNIRWDGQCGIFKHNVVYNGHYLCQHSC